MVVCYKRGLCPFSYHNFLLITINANLIPRLQVCDLELARDFDNLTLFTALQTQLDSAHLFIVLNEIIASMC